MKTVCSDQVNSLAKYLQGMLFCPMSEIRCEVVYIWIIRWAMRAQVRL